MTVKCKTQDYPGYYGRVKIPIRRGNLFVRSAPLVALIEERAPDLTQFEIASNADVNQRTLHRIWNEQEHVSVEIADRLICRILCDPSVWYLEDLTIYKGGPRGMVPL